VAARSLYPREEYDKYVSMYVRRRTEPAEYEGENCCTYAPTPGSGRRLGRCSKVVDESIRAPCAPGKSEINSERIANMLYTIAVVLIILWLLGLVTSTTMGGLIHVLLVIAIVVVLLRVISGRKPL
jgi:hypothetical protein